MNERLVIDLLVVLRTLRVAVENQHLAEHGRFDDADALKRGATCIIDAVDRMRMPFGGKEFLDVPLPMLGFGHRPRTLAGLKENPALR